jgi:translation initiation factor IF-3
MLNRLAKDTDDMSRVEFRSSLEGRFMTLILAPEKKSKKHQSEPSDSTPKE